VSYAANRSRDADGNLTFIGGLIEDYKKVDGGSLKERKPMRGHGLMQAIARVNRVFKDKPGGLVVDYLGIAQELKRTLSTYTESGGAGRTDIPQEEAVAAMLEKYEVCCGLFHGFDWSAWVGDSPTARLALLPNAQEHILSLEEGKS